MAPGGTEPGRFSLLGSAGIGETGGPYLKRFPEFRGYTHQQRIAATARTIEWCRASPTALK
jgi:hypothetical protein